MFSMVNGRSLSTHGANARPGSAAECTGGREQVGGRLWVGGGGVGVGMARTDRLFSSNCKIMHCFERQRVLRGYISGIHNLDGQVCF